LNPSLLSPYPVSAPPFRGHDDFIAHNPPHNTLKKILGKIGGKPTFQKH